MPTNLDDDTEKFDIFYHAEFEGRACVRVEVFIMSLRDSS